MHALVFAASWLEGKDAELFGTRVKFLNRFAWFWLREKALPVLGPFSPCPVESPLQSLPSVEPAMKPLLFLARGPVRDRCEVHVDASGGALSIFRVWDRSLLFNVGLELLTG